MVQAFMQMRSYFEQAGAPAGFGSQPGFGAQAGLVAPPAAPAAVPGSSIKVAVEGMKFQYQLTEDDLHKVFSRYGKVVAIRVDEAGTSGLITFEKQMDAYAAMTDLNGKVLNGLEGTLRISWAAGASAPPTAPLPGWGVPPMAGNSLWAGAPAGSMPYNPADRAVAPIAADSRGPTNAKGNRKYTCRFLIGIENDKDFQVARRIIGAKGVNMKRIFQQTEAKLRLRGQGSGYCEGAGLKESSEPLQLCISCTGAEGYTSAVRQVKEILKRVYDEYRQFCRENGRDPPDLQINLSENQLVYPKMTSEEVEAGSGDDEDAAGQDKGRRSRRSRNRGGKNNLGKGESGGPSERGEPGPNSPSEAEIEKLVDERNAARKVSNYQRADEIRQLLASSGVALMDEPGGRGQGKEVTSWRYWRE
jgi:hypothetical protein